MLVAVLIISTQISVSTRDRGVCVSRIALAGGLFFLGQLVVGVINLLLLAPVWLQLIHLLLADLIWISMILLGAAALREPAERSRAV